MSRPAGLTARAALTAAPEEMPTKMPSSVARRREMAMESSLLTCVLGDAARASSGQAGGLPAPVAVKKMDPAPPPTLAD